MGKYRDTSIIIQDLMVALSKMKFTEKNISVYYNKKRELIIRVNAGKIKGK